MLFFQLLKKRSLILQRQRQRDNGSYGAQRIRMLSSRHFLRFDILYNKVFHISCSTGLMVDILKAVRQSMMTLRKSLPNTLPNSFEMLTFRGYLFLLRQFSKKSLKLLSKRSQLDFDCYILSIPLQGSRFTRDLSWFELLCAPHVQKIKSC